MPSNILPFTPAQPAPRRAHLDATQAPDGTHETRRRRSLLQEVIVLVALALLVAVLITAVGAPR